MSDSDITFASPDNMRYWNDLVFAGEYELPYEPNKAPTVLDLGACCGAFAVWATKRWPGCTVLAYEPNHTAFTYLRENAKLGERINVMKAAVTSEPPTKLYCGSENLGQSSFFQSAETLDTYELPPILRPEQLPEAQVLKVDTEGCEWDIISSLLKAGRSYDAIMFEYHSYSDKRRLDSLLADAGYDLVELKAHHKDRGVAKYLRMQQQEAT